MQVKSLISEFVYYTNLDLNEKFHRPCAKIIMQLLEDGVYHLSVITQWHIIPLWSQWAHLCFVEYLTRIPPPPCPPFLV